MAQRTDKHLHARCCSHGMALACLIAVILLLLARPVRGDVALENQVKSAFVLNFVQFVEWPEGTFGKADDPIIVGVLEGDAMAASIAGAVEGKTAKGRKIVVNHFAPDAIGPCQILYLGSSDQAANILKNQAGKAILTIGDSEGFIDAGGVIRFYLEDRKVRFEINQAAAERAKLQISSKLLKLAKIVNK